MPASVNLAEKVPGGNVKRQRLANLRNDWWIARLHKDSALYPDTKRAYAVLEGLLESALKELEV